MAEDRRDDSDDTPPLSSDDMIRVARGQLESRREESTSARMVREAGATVARGVPAPGEESPGGDWEMLQEPPESTEDGVLVVEDVEPEATGRRPPPPVGTAPPPTRRHPAPPRQVRRPTESRPAPPPPPTMPRPVPPRPAPPREVRRPAPPDRSRPPSSPAEKARRGSAWIWILLLFTIGPLVTRITDAFNDSGDDSTAPTVVTAPPARPSNPFPGVWEARDADGSEMLLVVNDDGTFALVDTSAAPCRRVGLDAWFWEGAGLVTSGQQPTFRATGESGCIRDGAVASDTVEQLQSEFSYNSNGTLTLAAGGTCFHRRGQSGAGCS